jgi:ABC-type lipoprotein release transport system permease subunit
MWTERFHGEPGIVGKTRDPLAFGSAFVVMAMASLAACLVPAWRATRTDPGRALRD